MAAVVSLSTIARLMARICVFLLIIEIIDVILMVVFDPRLTLDQWGVAALTAWSFGNYFCSFFTCGPRTFIC